MITLDSPITVLPGVGPGKSAKYAKLDIFTLRDLLNHLPRRYDNRSVITPISHSVGVEKMAYLLTVATVPSVVRFRSHKSILKFRAFDDSGSAEIVFFQQDYLKNSFIVGNTYRFYGKAEVKNGKTTLSSPDFELWEEEKPLRPIVPVYGATAGLSRKTIEKDIQFVFTLLIEIPENLPKDLIVKHNLMGLADAYKTLHRPSTEEALAEARRRMAYQEIFTFCLCMRTTEKLEKSHGAYPCRNTTVEPLLALLPYSLTGDQLIAMEQIRSDMEKNTPMTRIVVGDVGCGKTVVACAALLFALQNGRQGLLMAPTEILAGQHYAELKPLFEKLGYEVGLLTGSTKAKEKKIIKEKLASGELPLCIGTHALITEDVALKNPGLVVIDEQHRFGAGQRATLAEKNRYSHLLVMSATPIPRSLSLIYYGSLAVSRIVEMPKGRQVVDTFVVDGSYRERLNQFIRKNVTEGGQVYIVCPAIEENEDEDAPEMESVIAYTEALQNALPDINIQMLHGKMKASEKEDIMGKFASGECPVLVSTTVIEVGVNIPTATLLIVENAERFGLSQLHQLRGRVGRGTKKSYCVLVQGDHLSDSGKARLQVMRRVHDGFVIAEEDLKQRGPGDWFASFGNEKIRQSGGANSDFGGEWADMDFWQSTTEDANLLLSRDEGLTEYPELRNAVNAVLKKNMGTCN